MAKTKRRKPKPIYDTPQDDIIEPSLTYNPSTGETFQSFARLPSSPPTTRPQTPEPQDEDVTQYDSPHHGDPFQSNPLPKTRFQGASILMNEFISHLDQMQAAILTTQYSSLVSPLCRCSGTQAIYRCKDCFFSPALCSGCIVASHTHNPFHRIEKWNGRFFASVDLQTLELVIHVGDSGRRCPNILETSVHTLTVVHTNGIHPVSVTYCGCDPVKDRYLQLLEARLFPATIERTETALTFTFLEDLHMHTLCSKKSVYDHHAAVQRLKDPINPHLVPDRCRESTRALRVWQILMKRRRSGRFYEIDTYLPLRHLGSLTTRCFACPEIGFNVDKAVVDSASESECHKYTLFLSLDGNFRLQRVNKRQDVDDVALLEGHAYFVDDDEYRAYTKRVNPSSDNSTCAHLRAVRLQNAIKFKNAAVSGVISVQCARHGFYMPNGTADLEKGEAYARSDYVLIQVLDEHQQQRWIMVSYDIWCQYWKNLHSRISAQFPEKLSLLDNIRGAIPKMHIKNHIEECQVRWSFNYLSHSGETCGEKIETSWAEQNQAAASTKQQNAGHRHDSLNDHFDFWNWGKTQTLVPYLEAKYKDVKNRLESREKSITELRTTLTTTYSTQTLSEWSALDLQPQRVDDVWTSPCIAKSKSGRPLSQLKAYQDLLAAENVGRLAGHCEGSDATFLSKSLKIEAEQHRIRCMLSNKEPPVSEISTARLALHTLLKPWVQDQEKRYPNLRNDKPSIDFTQPEHVSLFLPSNFTVMRPPELQLLVSSEWVLREGQCHDALNTLRLAIKTFNANFKFKQDNVRGQTTNTRSQLFLSMLSDDKVSALDKYTRCRDALLNLGFSPNDKTLQPLNKSQLWGRNMGLPAELGDTREDEPWFWVVGRPSGLSLSEEKDWNYEVDRARWSRLWAAKERGREEAEILEEEILRVYKSSSKMASIWTSLATQNASAPGAVSYAHKQAAMYESFADEAFKAISGPFRSAFLSYPDSILTSRQPQQPHSLLTPLPLPLVAVG